MKKRSYVKTNAVIYDSDQELNEIEETDITPRDEQSCQPKKSFHISRKKKLSLGQFQNGDAFIDIRELYPCKKSKKVRRGRGICLTLTQWRKIVGLMPEIEKSISEILPKNEP
ncbi:RNA polymerase II transcriptional coactivator [Mucor circinelloides]